MRPAYSRAFLAAGMALALLPLRLSAQFSDKDRRRGETMLKVSLDEVREHFWDRGLKGVPLDSLEQAALVEIRASTSNAQINGVIAKVFFAIDDSHTRFLPPGFAADLKLGWEALPIGDSVYITAVDSGGEAERAGLTVGDRIIAVEGWSVERSRWWDLLYLIQYLQPRGQVVLTVARGDDPPLEIVAPSTVREGRTFFDLATGSDWYELVRKAESEYVGWDSRFVAVGDSVLYWRLRTFAVWPDFIKDGLHRARGKHTLILDLRDNGGGLVMTLNAMLDRVARADQVGDTLNVVRERDRVRVERVERIRESERFTGKLIVLTNYGSMSASEAFADGVQRLGRGTVLGDRTAGYLTQARGYGHLTPGSIAVFYGIQIADAMIERPDGSRVEKHGVLPDELITPTAEDLAAHRDPVLARALQIAGREYDPVGAYLMATRLGTKVREY